MPDLDVQECYDSDSSDNEDNYSKLLTSVSQLDSTQRVKPASRKEISSEVSEYNLTKGEDVTKNLVTAQELAKSLGKKSSHASITKKFKKVTDKSKILQKPLEKPVEEKIKRSIGFQNVRKQLERWNAIVTRNSLQDHIKFPLSDNVRMKMCDSKDFLKQFRTVTPLEEQIAKALKQEPIQKKDEEAEDDFPLTLEEMLEKRKEMAKLRAQLSYSEAKAQRQSKIKSKKYHRILKREKLRQQLKEFELLQKTDPDAALQKLAELDKSRAQERASLRHRNTGHWAKNLQVRAKYDVESRKVLADQLKMSREITQKVHIMESSDEDEEGGETEENHKSDVPKSSLNTSKDNPWRLDISESVQNFLSNYKKFWAEENKKKNENQTENGNDVKLIPGSSSKTENGEVVKEVVETEQEPQVTKPEKFVNGDVEIVSKKRKETPEETKPKESSINVQVKSASKKKKKTPEGDAKSSEPEVEVVAKPTKKKEKMKKKKVTPSINISSISGIWIVEPVEDSPTPEPEIKKKRKGDDIDILFEDLSDKLMKKAKKKVKRMASTLRREERKEQNKRKEKDKDDEEFDLSFKNSLVIQRPDMDVGLKEGGDGDAVSGNVAANSNLAVTTVVETVTEKDSKEEAPPEIDPTKFIHVKPKRLRTHLPDNVTGGDDDAIDEEKTQQMTVEEAFGDDDVLAEFREMKNEEEKSKQVEISNSLPGWGSWGGMGIVHERKKKRLILTPPQKKRQMKDNVIINEEGNPNLRNHLVKEVPHPFKSVEAFEANIRTPVGRDWVPETAHRKLIQQQIETKLGAIIDPMDENELVKLNKNYKSPYKGKKKGNKKSNV